MIRILNLYSGLGGNRKLWKDCEVTSVEFNPEIAQVYRDRYPQDTLIVGDAHAYLLEHFKEFDFIWASPPCQTHSSFRQNVCVRFRDTPAVYPDMKLYQEIIFLRSNCNEEQRWVVENVNPYYEPLIPPDARLGRHLFWCNFTIGRFEFKHDEIIRTAQIPQLQKYHGIDLSPYKFPNKRQLLRNCVDSDLGKHVFDCAYFEFTEYEQLPLFEHA